MFKSAELHSRRLGIGVTCPAARNGSHFYVGGVDKRMHAFRAEDRIQVFEVAAENESKVTSIVADEKFVIFATDGGNVINITADGPKRLWQFNAADSVVGPIVKEGKSLFVASKDTNVYRVDVLT